MGSATESPKIPQTSVSRAKAATLLLVEDESDFRDLLREALASAGYRVLIGENGVEELYVANQCSDVIDLLLTDVIMPQM